MIKVIAVRTTSSAYGSVYINSVYSLSLNND